LILRIALILIGTFAALVAVVWAMQEKLVFFPPPVPMQQGRGAERIDYVSTDGQPLFGFFVAGAPATDAPSRATNPGPARAPASRGLILHFHGNGDLANNWIDWAREVAQRTGWPVFLAEYRGYGGLPGRPTYDGIMRDARATLAVLQDRYGVRASDVVLYGHSLGTGVAAQLAAEQDARAVLLEAPISSIVDMGRRSFMPPFSLVVPWICRMHFAPVDHVCKAESPVWVVCGDVDEVVPASMSRSVFSAARHKGEFCLIAGARHGDVADRGGEEYWKWVGRALGN
jgi:fermentation-respiration switch protein FrsA (DUF1100 family)